jgi:hypothetical protein
MKHIGAMNEALVKPGDYSCYADQLQDEKEALQQKPGSMAELTLTENYLSLPVCSTMRWRGVISFQSNSQFDS